MLYSKLTCFHKRGRDLHPLEKLQLCCRVTRGIVLLCERSFDNKPFTQNSIHESDKLDRHNLPSFRCFFHRLRSIDIQTKDTLKPATNERAAATTYVELFLSCPMLRIFYFSFTDARCRNSPARGVTVPSGKMCTIESIPVKCYLWGTGQYGIR